MRVILITGAGTGIGRAIALTLAAPGTSLFLVGRREGPLEDTARACGERGARAQAFPGDVTEQAFPRLLAAGLEAMTDHLDVLVNNAGAFTPDSLADSTDELWERTLAVNLTAPYRLTRELLPLLKKGNHPSVVMISSNLGVKPIPRTLSYSVSKAGLNMLVTALAPELGALGVRVNGVCPGVVDTPIHDRFGTQEERAAYFNQLSSAIPAGRVGSPQDVAHLVAYLASPDASYVTGANIVIDGGLVLT
jgi:NAD(P)-dependent dehydrogenase (short-subunit alcohol dehydrogenase family)